MEDANGREKWVARSLDGARPVTVLEMARGLVAGRNPGWSVAETSQPGLRSPVQCHAMLRVLVRRGFIQPAC